MVSMLAVLLVMASLATAVTRRAPGTPARGAISPAGGLKLDPNTATWWELTVIPGIGETTAHRIVSFRSDHGDASGIPFRSPADLESVHGIGPKTVVRMAPYLTFAPAGPPKPSQEARRMNSAGSVGRT